VDGFSEGTSAAAWGGLTEVEPVVRGWLWRRCRGDSEVDDIVQETLLRAARYRGRLERSDRLAGWTLSIAANALRDRKRRELRHGAVDEHEFDFDTVACMRGEIVAESSPSTLRIAGAWVSSDEALAHLREALLRLRPRERELLLDFYGGASMRELATRLGVGAAAIKCRLYRARRMLTRVLERRLRSAVCGPGALA